MPLQLGSFIFEDWEIPSSVKGLLSGPQMLAVKKQIGGARVIDAMGADPEDVKWSGRFQGGDVVGRADQLASMRDKGQPLTLVCDQVVLTVLIKKFVFDYERPYQAPYDIELIVLPDVSDNASPALDDLVGDDLTSSDNILSGAVTGGTPSAASLISGGGTP